MIGAAADVIAAGGAAIAAVLGGLALVLTAFNRSDLRITRKQTETGNGITLAAQVDRIKADLAEQRPLLEWARMMRAKELLGVSSLEPGDMERAESILHRPIDPPL